MALWDELDVVLPPLDCVCNARAVAVSREEQQRLVKFLEGLNENYEAIIDQVMMLDPLPDRNTETCPSQSSPTCRVVLD